MDKGLLIEFEKGLNSFAAILEEWKATNGDVKETYYKIFSAVKDFDKHIARRYDGIGGSRYLETVIYQLVDDLYDISEIDEFSPQVKADTLRFVKFVEGTVAFAVAAFPAAASLPACGPLTGIINYAYALIGKLLHG